MSDVLPVEITQHHPLPLTQLPVGWARVWLTDIASNVSPGFASGKNSSDGKGVPHLRPMNIGRDGQIDLTVVKSVASSEGTELAAGDVLFNNTNSPELVGKTALISEREAGFAYSNHMTRVRLEPSVEPVFVARQLHFLWMSGYLKTRCTNHVNQASISSKTLASTIPLLLAPTAEQKQISERLEAALSDLDDGENELKTAQRKLAQYRQALLKAALDGGLTAEWRLQHSQSDKGLETGAQLLERVLRERHARWEARQLLKFEEQGKPPPKGWKDKYPEPTKPELVELPALPQGWVWASLDMLGDIVSGVAKGTKRDPNVAVREVPYLRVANVQRGYFDLSEVRTIFATERDIRDLTLEEGDVLFNEGGDRDKLGRGWVWRNEIAGCIHQNHVFRMRPYLSDTLPELISHHGNTFGKAWFQTAGKQTTNLASINMAMLRAFPVPIAPTEEQREALRLLALQSAALDDQEASVVRGLKQADAQRKNILRAAFSGELLPQDHQGESASLLLQRIRAMRLEPETQPQNRKARKQVETMVRKLEDVLAEAADWVPAQEAFRRCGIADGAHTDEIEALYAELRALDKANRVSVEAVTDSQGRKLYDRLRRVPVA